MDNIVRTLSYRKLPEEKTEMTKPAENETSKQPQSWAEAAKAAGVLVLSSQEQFDEVIIETAPKKSVTKKTQKNIDWRSQRKRQVQFSQSLTRKTSRKLLLPTSQDS